MCEVRGCLQAQRLVEITLRTWRMLFVTDHFACSPMENHTRPQAKPQTTTTMHTAPQADRAHPVWVTSLRL